MQCRKLPPCLPDQSTGHVVFLATLLVFLTVNVPASESGVFALPTSINYSPSHSEPMSWNCRTSPDMTSAGDLRQRRASASGSRDEGSNPSITSDSRGLRRDTWHFLGYQAATIGFLYALPEGVSGWTEEQKEGYSMSIWWDNVTHPQIDSDDFYINYILHPYWGAAYFRSRTRAWLQ